MPELLERPRFEQIALWCDIVMHATGIDAAEGSEAMRLGTGIEYVQHRTISGDDGVGNQKPVTAPRNRLGAHDHRRLEPGKVQKILQRLLEFPGLHVVGVSAEARVPPQRVVRIAATAAPATQRGEM